MSSSITIAGIEIPQADWDATPESVRALVTVLSERLAHIEELLNQNSQNSSRPPSSDGFGKPGQSTAEKQSQKKPKKKRSRSGSSSKPPKLYPIESCSEVHVHVLERCM
jgi:hypothetical protein